MNHSGVQVSNSPTNLSLFETFPKVLLPIRSLNHVSFAVPEPTKTGHFFCKVLGFRVVRRPNFSFDGVWLYNYGIQIHLIKGIALDRPMLLQPNTDHISFQADDLNSLQKRLETLNIPYIVETFEEEGLRQLFFKESSSGIMIEICNCEVFPMEYIE
eukprot:jgi/Galph1/4514/GphlegSOOS_G3192.1